jgi:hypothetical protein
LMKTVILRYYAQIIKKRHWIKIKKDYQNIRGVMDLRASLLFSALTKKGQRRG